MRLLRSTIISPFAHQRTYSHIVFEYSKQRKNAVSHNLQKYLHWLINVCLRCFFSLQILYCVKWEIPRCTEYYGFVLRLSEILHFNRQKSMITFISILTECQCPIRCLIIKTPTNAHTFKSIHIQIDLEYIVLYLMIYLFVNLASNASHINWN